MSADHVCHNTRISNYIIALSAKSKQDGGFLQSTVERDGDKNKQMGHDVGQKNHGSIKNMKLMEEVFKKHHVVEDTDIFFSIICK